MRGIFLVFVGSLSEGGGGVVLLPLACGWLPEGEVVGVEVEAWCSLRIVFGRAVERFAEDGTAQAAL